MQAQGLRAEHKPTRFLVILPRQLGDVILGLPIIEELRRGFPSAQIVWVAHPLAREVLEDQPGLTDIFFLPQGKFRYVTSRKGILGEIERALGQVLYELKFLIRLRGFRADVVIDAMNNPRTSIMSFVSGAARRISFGTRFHRNMMFTDVIDRKEVSTGYLGTARLKLLAPLGISSERATAEEMNRQLAGIRIYRNRQQAEKITNLLASFEFDLNQRPFIVICPPSRREVRRWPNAYFLEIARKLVFKHNIAVVWSWGPQEDQLVKPLHEALVKELREAHQPEGFSSFLPLLTIKETAELCSKARCWVGLTSGLCHVAVASGCHTIEIHGPTNPVSWTHPDSSKHRSITRNTGCLGCERYSCKLERRECLEDLRPEVVLREIEDLLKL